MKEIRKNYQKFDPEIKKNYFSFLYELFQFKFRLLSPKDDGFSTRDGRVLEQDRTVILTCASARSQAQGQKCRTPEAVGLKHHEWCFYCFCSHHINFRNLKF